MTTTPGTAAAVEAERALLGAVLLRPELLPMLSALKPEDLLSPAHRVVLAAVRRVEASGAQLDLVTLKAALEASRELGAAGGAAGIAGLLDALPVSGGAWAASVEAWLGIVTAGARRRRLAAVGERLTQAARDPDADAATVLERGLAALTDAAGAIGCAVDLDPATGIAEARERLQRGLDSEAVGWHTGLIDLDRRLGWLRPGQLVLVGARTGVGKSTLLQNMGEGIAKAGGRVLGVSAEMGRSEFNVRRLCAEAGVPADRFEAGGVTPTPRELAALDAAASALSERRFVVHAAAPAPLELRALARFARAGMGGLDALLVDYLQLLPPGVGKRGETREAEVARVSRALKRLAVDLDVLVVAATQLNRSAEGRRDPRPRLSDLRESGAQEQDADVVLLLHADEKQPGVVDADVAKHRHRAPGRCRLTFDGARHRFMDYARGEDE